MDLLLDMVHHNPGEKPFVTSFSDPSKLKAFNYNGQVFKHINCVATFDALNLNLWPQGSNEKEWLDAFTREREKEILGAKQEGLKVFYHTDLFVLPQSIVEIYKDSICDNDGRLTLESEMTLKLHAVMFDEIFSRFSDIDGLIIRVGETYLFDTPYHVGNGAVAYNEGEPNKDEKDGFIKLLKFLREEICVKHGKYVIFRTWDCHSNRFHADLDYYLDITEKIEPHDKLIFSIKHTQLDFWRYVEFNPCLTKGRHSQIIEVQCQREYEGKGAYPSYVMGGVINGFPESNHPKGLKDIIDHPLIKGLYTWSRGGGWYGPYIKNELWPDMNSFVIANWFNNPDKDEKRLFSEYCSKILGLNTTSTKQFRNFINLCDQAVMKGRYCQAFDINRDMSFLPTNNWMRDDRLGGMDMLQPVFDYLFENDRILEALNEKKESVALWSEAIEVLDNLVFPNLEDEEFIKNSVLYGRLLFEFVEKSWNLIANKYVYKKTGKWLSDNINKDLRDCQLAWKKYQNLSENPDMPSIYQGTYWNLPDKVIRPGLIDSINNLHVLAANISD